MSYSVKGETITLTRGDTFICKVNILDSEGLPYLPAPGDKVRFALKEKLTDPEPLFVKDIPIDTCILKIDPEDTKSLSFGSYIYDIQLTKENGDVDTFITKNTLKLTEEVD